MTSLALQPSVELLARTGDELSAFLESLPGHVRGGRFEEAHRQCQALIARFPAELREGRWAQAWARVVEALGELRHALETRAKAYALARWEDASRAYEHWLDAWRAAQTGSLAPARRPLRPLKLARTAFHVSAGLLGVSLYHFVLTRGQASAILFALLGVCGGLEVARRFSGRLNHLLVARLFHSMARPGECHRVNSATWGLAALCLLVPWAPKAAVIAGVLVMALADPAASWAGRAWGKRKLYRDKSWVGAFAFALTAAVVCAAYLLGLQPGVPVPRALAAALAVAVAGAAVEVFSGRVDDNFAVPLAACLAATPFLSAGP